MMPESAKLTTMDREHMVSYLSEVLESTGADDTCRRYETAIVSMVDQNPWTDLSIEQICESIMEGEAPDLAFAAFYALCTYFRRHQNLTEYGDLISKKRRQFGMRPSFAFLELMYKKARNPHSLELIEDADYLCSPEVLGSNYGVLHCFSEYVADACERDLARAKFLIDKYMDRALERVNESLRISRGYPKFYLTRARLRMISAIHANDTEREILYNSALQDIDTAVSAEKVMAKMIDYQITGTRIQMNYYEQVLNKNITKQEAQLTEKIQDINVKNLEFLGFFSAIIGLLLANIQLVQNLSFAAAATLVVVLSCCVITAFGALGFILHGTKERVKINCVIIGLGLFLTILSLLYGAYYAM